MLIDSHAHLDFPQFAADLPEVLTRAEEHGVGGVISVGTDLASSRRACALAEHDTRLVATAGIHPHEAARVQNEDWAAIEALCREPRVVAVGETGLDYYYDFSPPEVQREVFRRELRLSAAVKLPLVIHVRDAYEDAFALIAEEGLPAGGVLHCFSGGPKECERALALGLYLSFAGIVTFPKAHELQEAARLVPAERLLVETDAPYLAPVPRRGVRNEPAYVVHTAQRLAELRGVELEELASCTRLNTLRLFALRELWPALAAPDGAKR